MSVFTVIVAINSAKWGRTVPKSVAKIADRCGVTFDGGGIPDVVSPTFDLCYSAATKTVALKFAKAVKRGGWKCHCIEENSMLMRTLKI